jgi:hypothetical protein
MLAVNHLLPLRSSCICTGRCLAPTLHRATEARFIHLNSLIFAVAVGDPDTFRLQKIHPDFIRLARFNQGEQMGGHFLHLRSGGFIATVAGSFEPHTAAVPGRQALCGARQCAVRRGRPMAGRLRRAHRQGCAEGGGLGGQFALDPPDCAGANIERVAILRMPVPPACKALRIAVSVAASILGRPSVVPSARARARPALTRSRIMARSNSANTPII